MSEALKPCPFCGSKATIIDSHDEVNMEGPLPYGVECDGCGVDIGGWHSPEDAAYEWNTRAALEQPSTAEIRAQALEEIFVKLLNEFESYEPGTNDYAACCVADTLLLTLFPEYKDVQKKVRAKRIREEGR